eukprot:TRINITY_DN926_c0_g1_i1.p1 TRINITY_DN926_c0_g1~~TRINITY_DN926_c0_g1_i1.p1  ORF type:complete len:466 (-),score=87.52 TRINITY_DN926_c0_g1_i1:30-1427(-)
MLIYAAVRCRSFLVRLQSTTLKSAKVVDFALSKSTAINHFLRWNKHVLAPTGLKNLEATSTTKAVFLPFWSCPTTVDVDVRGEVGYVYYTYRMVQKELKTVRKVSWKSMDWHRRGTSDYGIDNVASQVYGAYKYRRAYADAAKTSVGQARPLYAEMMDQADEVHEFQMRPDIALEMTRAAIEQAELSAAERYLLKRYEADEVRNVQVRLRFGSGGRCFPLYLPAHVIDYSYRGHPFRAIVGGTTGLVCGERQYSMLKCALLTTVPLTSLLLFVHLNPMQVALATALCAAGTAWVAGQLPQWRWYAKERQRRQELQSEQSRKWEQAEADWRESADQQAQNERDEWERAKREQDEQKSRGYSNQQQQQQQQQQQNQQQQKQQREFHDKSYTAHAESDDNLYAILQVQPNASTEDIKTAFRTLTMRYHPDVVRDESAKASASVKYREILRAYQILRDPKKRAAYDRGF